MAEDEKVQTHSGIKAAGSIATDIVHARHDTNNSQGQIREFAGREFLGPGQARFGHPHPSFEEIVERAQPKPSGVLKVSILRHSASAMFWLSKIFDRLGQQFHAWSVPVRPLSSLELAYLNEPGYSLEELLDALVRGNEPVPLPKPRTPVAKSCPDIGSKQRDCKRNATP